MRKFKYWTASINERGQVITRKTPHTNKRDAIAEARSGGGWNGCTIGVVRADEYQRPTNECIFAAKG